MIDNKKTTNKGEKNALPTSTTIEPRVPRFMDVWVHGSSPLDINLDNVTSIILPPLIWLESDTIPLKIVDAEYSGPRPSLNGSILRCPYEFSSFHFHWGTKLKNGSEHRTMGKCSPMEIHVVFYNISYSNTCEAFNAEDGKLILTYMCKLDRHENVTLENMTSNLKKINKPGDLIEIDSFALSNLFDNDLQNYLMYWSACEVIRENTVLWMISSKEISISEAQLSRMRSLRGHNNKCILSNCRLAKLSGGNKVLRVTQHSMDQKKNRSAVGKDSIALAAPEQTDIPGNMVKSGTSAQTIEKEPEPNNSNIKSDIVKKEPEPNNTNIKSDIVKKETEPNNTKIKSDIVKKEPEPNNSNIKSDVAKNDTVIISIVTTPPIANQKLKNENWSKKEIKPTKSLDLEDQRRDVEYILNLTKPLCTNNKEKNILNESGLTKDMVINSIDSFILDLENDDKVDLKISQWPEVQKTHREGVRMNTTALRREMRIKNNKDVISTQSHDLEEQLEEVVLVTENFESDLNLIKPLDTINNNEKSIPNDKEQTKDMIISSIDDLLLNMTNDDKVELKTSQRPSVLKTHREGVRMNATALRRELHIKNRQQKNNENTKNKVHKF